MRPPGPANFGGISGVQFGPALFAGGSAAMDADPLASWLHTVLSGAQDTAGDSLFAHSGVHPALGAARGDGIHEPFTDAYRSQQEMPPELSQKHRQQHMLQQGGMYADPRAGNGADPIAAYGAPRAPRPAVVSLIQRCAAARDFDGLERCLQSVAADEGGGEAARTEAFSCAVDSLVNAGEIARASAALMCMISIRLQPPVATLGGVCKNLATQGNTRQIQAIVDALEAQGVKLSESIFASLIYACGAAQPPELERAEGVVYDVLARGLRPQPLEKVLKHVLGRTRTKELFAVMAIASQVEGVRATSPSPYDGQAAAANAYAPGLAAAAALAPPAAAQPPRQRPAAPMPAPEIAAGFPGAPARTNERGRSGLRYVPGAALLQAASFPPLDAQLTTDQR